MNKKNSLKIQTNAPLPSSSFFNEKIEANNRNDYRASWAISLHTFLLIIIINNNDFNDNH